MWLWCRPSIFSQLIVVESNIKIETRVKCKRIQSVVGCGVFGVPRCAFLLCVFVCLVWFAAPGNRLQLAWGLDESLATTTTTTTTENKTGRSLLQLRAFETFVGLMVVTTIMVVTTHCAFLTVCLIGRGWFVVGRL